MNAQTTKDRRWERIERAALAVAPLTAGRELSDGRWDEGWTLASLIDWAKQFVDAIDEAKEADKS